MVKLYVEGGGDAHSLRTACRKGFAIFLENAGLRGHLPRVVACGSRRDAYESFRTACENGEDAFLLVDSETAVADCHQDGQTKDGTPWRHLAERQEDQWRKPEMAEDWQCHLMVQCMEGWLLADRDTLKAFFGQEFNDHALPGTATVESIDKNEIFMSLKKATDKCRTKGRYDKGKHSFIILESIDPIRVMESCPWCKRFVEELKHRMNAREASR